MTDIVKIYNPANANTLTPEQIAAMQKLTPDEIRILAEAYPNYMFSKNYLLIIDSTLRPTEKNLPNISTWQTLYNLREKNGQRKWIAYGFKGARQPKIIQVGKTNNVRRGKIDVVDLSDAELLSLPGFKTANGEIPATQVPVMKINKTKTPNNA